MIRCIIVDDEPLALDLMEDFIHKVPFLELVCRCESAVDALEILQNQKIDLIFLDIQMHDITGIQLLKSLKNSPMVILTTAYQQYAIEGYDLNVMDYLLKPIPFDRFFKAATKAYQYFNLCNRVKTEEQPQIAPPANTNNEENDDFLFVKSDYKTVKINLKDISYIEGLKDYVKIYTTLKPIPILSLLTLKSLEEKLPAKDFIRVHRSFIVSLNKIESIQKSRIKIGDKLIPISDYYKDNFSKLIKGKNI
ncbi:MAG: LytTR family DNA-binding domain-containing protein [Bacteroidota bacterium]|nr:LytTR family DNA-binding domain-containing protein [Bacteroidota bacterium]MDP4272946.1 LytTR family DNA-binding domain-containing protein [Bacteroidota bacterium]